MTEPLRVLIVDDEPLARDSIRALLADDAEMRVVGEGTGSDAEALIARARPDIMFLDIQMPEVDGFGVLDRVGADTVPAVIFVTAYDQYAVRAFEVHALDYLLKPFDDNRFAGALARAKERVGARRRGEVDNRIAELLKERDLSRTRFLIPVRDKTIVVEAAQIDWIEASDYYVTLHAGAAAHLLRQAVLPRTPLGDRERRPRARDPSSVPRRLRAGAGGRTADQVEPESKEGVRGAVSVMARALRRAQSARIT